MKPSSPAPTDYVPAANNGGRTGWPPALLQDDNRKLSQWFSSRLGARYALKVAIKERRGEQKPSES